MEVAHIDAFRSDPARFWSFYRPRLHSLDGIEPNPAHEALAELERRGLLEARDHPEHRHAPHQGRLRAGDRGARLDPHRELPGVRRRPTSSPRSRSCSTTRAWPTCRACASLVKPDVVLFGELLPAEAMAEAEALASRADLLLCVGSSLEVYPGRRAALGDARRAAAGSRSSPRARRPTTATPALRLDGDVADELSAVVAALYALRR